MKVPYKVIGKTRPGVSGGGEKRYYASKVTQERIDARELGRMIAQNTGMSVPDTIGVLEALIETVPKLVANGHVVDLNDFGTFNAYINSRGEESPQRVTVRSILGAKIVFRPGKAFRRALQRMTFIRLR